MADVALSIRQPWAWLIAAGYKDFENRTWLTRFRGEFYIHASKTPDDVTLEEIARHPIYRKALKFVDLSKAELNYGGIIGRARLVDCIKTPRPTSIWFEGPYGFKIQDAGLIKFIPYMGRQNFFPVQI